MENWNKLIHDFDTVESDKPLSTVFLYTGSKTIKEIEANCNCVNVNYKNNKLHIKWMPKHKKRPYESNRKILVVYEDDTLDDLTIKARFV